MSEILDLGYGNPGFLQEEWDAHNLLDSVKSKDIMAYMHGKRIFPELEAAIKELHLKYKNALITETTQIIITVGAVQALQAAMIAYRKQTGNNKLYVPKPYWVRFNDFADFSGMQMVEQNQNSIKLITSPNNPDGMDQSRMQADIRDACYNWPHYTQNVVEFKDKVSVFSLSKLSGHSSTRIGWAVVQDPELASFMKNFVNIITSGVSVEAQLNACQIISKLGKDPSFFESAAETLKYRYLELAGILQERNLPINVLSNQGMFWYINCDPSIINKLNIICPPGSDFGDSRPNTFRLNLGVDSVIYDQFIHRLKSL